MGELKREEVDFLEWMYFESEEFQEKQTQLLEFKMDTLKELEH